MGWRPKPESNADIRRLNYETVRLLGLLRYSIAPLSARIPNRHDRNVATTQHGRTPNRNKL